MNHDDTLDDEVGVVVHDAICTLALLFAQHHDTRAAADLEAVTALIRHARRRLPHIVADARDQDTSWAEIAARLHLSRLGAMARYGHHARTRPQPLNLD